MKLQKSKYKPLINAVFIENGKNKFKRKIWNCWVWKPNSPLKSNYLGRNK
jgi:hypothetical protein